MAALLAPPALAGGRTITGSLQGPYPDGATSAVVELRDAEGRMAAEQRFEIGRDTKAIAFSFEAPTIDLTLLAAVFVHGRPQLLSDKIPVPAGTATVDMGMLPLKPYQPLAFASTLHCGKTEAVLGFTDQGAVLQTGGERIDLVPAGKSPGSRLVAPGDPTTFVEPRGRKALLSLRGKTLPECSAELGAKAP